MKLWVCVYLKLKTYTKFLGIFSETPTTWGWLSVFITVNGQSDHLMFYSCKHMHVWSSPLLHGYSVQDTADSVRHQKQLHCLKISRRQVSWETPNSINSIAYTFRNGVNYHVAGNVRENVWFFGSVLGPFKASVELGPLFLLGLDSLSLDVLFAYTFQRL